MSDEGGVISSDVANYVTPQQVTPVAGKGALGTWRSQLDSRTQSRGTIVLEAGTSLEVNHSGEGCMRASALASSSVGRPLRESQGQNRTREIRPSGIVGGLAET
jgi:hypothetical protein